jgi:hypothetical protein
MAEDAWDVETIVAAVLRRLGRLPNGASSATAAAADQADGGLVVPAPVVSLATLEQRLTDRPPAAVTRVVSPETVAARLDGVQRLVVRRGAVVTPAVRDLLRERGITLVTALEKSSCGTTPRSLVLASVAANYDPAPLVASLAPVANVVETAADDWTAGIDALAAHVGGDAALALLVTDRVAATLCLANRYPHIRAAAVRDAAEVSAVTRAIGVNMLVVDPAECGTATLTAIAHRFCQIGPQPCPAALDHALDRAMQSGPCLRDAQEGHSSTARRHADAYR